MKTETHSTAQAARSPIAGACVDIDGGSWHKDGQACEQCGFGLDDFGDTRGFWSEPLVHLPVENSVTATAVSAVAQEAAL